MSMADGLTVKGEMWECRQVRGCWSPTAETRVIDAVSGTPNYICITCMFSNIKYIYIWIIRQASSFTSAVDEFVSICLTTIAHTLTLIDPHDAKITLLMCGRHGRP